MKVNTISDKKLNEGFPPEIVEQIKTMVESIKFGQVTIIVQDSKVIQIDKIEKVRLK